jgi:hypothetical protein
VIFVKDTVRDASAIDAAEDLDIRTAVWLGKVNREAGSSHWRKAAGASYRWMAAARTALTVRRKKWWSPVAA